MQHGEQPILTRAHHRYWRWRTRSKGLDVEVQALCIVDVRHAPHRTHQDIVAFEWLWAEEPGRTAQRHPAATGGGRSRV